MCVSQDLFKEQSHGLGLFSKEYSRAPCGASSSLLQRIPYSLERVNKMGTHFSILTLEHF